MIFLFVSDTKSKSLGSESGARADRKVAKRLVWPLALSHKIAVKTFPADFPEKPDLIL